MLSQNWITTAPYLRPLAHFTHKTRLRAYGPSLVGWGVTIGIVAVNFLEVTPILRRDVLQHIPLVGGFWQKKLEARERAD
jgi:Ni/Fe-hydrogenase subunit HybB-like protein